MASNINYENFRNYHIYIKPTSKTKCHYHTTTYGLHSLQYTAATIWNDFPDSIKMIDNLAEFTNILWKHMKSVS